MRTAAMAGVLGFAAFTVSACEFRTAADVEAELEAHYNGKMASVDNSLDTSEFGVVVNEQTFKHIAAGMWRFTASTDGKSDRQVRKRCYSNPQRADQTLDMTPVASLIARCKTLKFQPGGSYNIVHDCDNGQAQLTGGTTISGDLTTSYVIETRLSFRPRWQGLERYSSTTVAERMGDC